MHALLQRIVPACYLTSHSSLKLQLLTLDPVVFSKSLQGTCKLEKLLQQITQL